MIIDDIQKTINKLRPYKLYGTKENIDKVRDLLPYYIEQIELPEYFFNEDMMDKLILIDVENEYWAHGDDEIEL